MHDLCICSEWSIQEDKSEGKKEDLNCDLWNCNGYNHGTYEIKGNKIEFHNNKKSYISYEFEVKKEINQTYLILKEKNYYGTTITKYKKAN